MPPTYNEEMKRDVYRDLAAKQWLHARSAHLVAAFDASEMTAKELAEHVLKKLGLEVPNDPIMALTHYLEGRDVGAREASARDNRSVGSALDTLEGSAVDQFFAKLEGRSEV